MEFDIDNLPIEGNSGIKSLCRIADELGYNDPLHQIVNNDGSCIGDLICFLEDNPGAIEAIINWTKDNYQEELDEINSDDEDYW